MRIKNIVKEMRRQVVNKYKKQSSFHIILYNSVLFYLLSRLFLWLFKDNRMSTNLVYHSGTTYSVKPLSPFQWVKMKVLKISVP